jgi:hypothetical protein
VPRSGSGEADHHRQTLGRHVQRKDARHDHQDRPGAQRPYRARTTEVLKSHRARQPKERMAAKSWADPGLVFPNTLGAIGRRHYLMESYRRLLKAPGLPSDIRFHHLRHTSARAWAPSCSLQQDARPHRPGDDLEALGPRP